MTNPRGLQISASPDVIEYDGRELLARAPRYEEAGFDSLWEGDHTLPWHHTGGHCSSATVMVEAYLATTKRIKVVLLMPPIGTRHHPVDVALTAASMGVLHPGRVGLCLAVGEAMNEKTTTGFWPSVSERVERLDEAAQLIRKCWEANDYLKFRGKYFNSFFYLYDRPTQGIPLFCAAGGPVVAEVAGKYCDGFISLNPPSRYRDVLIPTFERAAKKAGRDPSTLERIAWVSTCYHPDREKALAKARLYGGLLIPECYHQIQDPRIIEARAALVSDKALVSVFSIATSPDELISKLEEYIQAGVNHLVIAEGSPDPDLTIEACKKKVIPYLKEQYSKR